MLYICVAQVLDDLVERLPEQFDMEDIRGRVDEFSPYVMVAIQVGSVSEPLQLYLDFMPIRTSCTSSTSTTNKPYFIASPVSKRAPSFLSDVGVPQNYTLLPYVWLVALNNRCPLRAHQPICV